MISPLLRDGGDGSSIPSSGIELTSENLMFSQSILALNHEGNCIDLGTPALPLTSEAGVKTWNMSIFPVGINSHEENNTTTILYVPDSSTVSDCQSLEFPKVYSVKRGPSLTILDNDKKTKQWIGSFTVTNDTISIQNNGEEDVVLGIEFDGNGAQWDISNTITLAPGVVTDIPATSSATPSLISKLSIAMSPYHWVPLPSAPTEAVTLNITVSEKVPKQTVS